ncbi:lysine exporter LysO family protein [Anaerovorax odorimutans]|uniref:lysine exporter LysO family protein n=1 Tax=Anaerovorax odorimutans TaxID=109327 RepID=UPI0004251FA4|nr:lysine exporter LysO family protein [Anaerovorax odorimutans]
MSKSIVIALLIGVLSGYLFIPDVIINHSEYMLSGGLCLLLFLVGLDIGRQDSIFKDIKKTGFKILLFPIATIIGTLVFSAIAGLLLPITVRESMAIGSGFGWYTLAPIILADYSSSISAISFLHNVMREFFSILIIPIVAQKIGYLETISLPGAAAMDVCLPIVEKTTNSNVAVYSFVSGAIISMAVPVLVPFIIGL